MSSAVILSLPDEKPPALTQSDSLLTALNRASHSSLLTGETTALGVSETGYAIYSYQGEDWVITQSGDWADSLRVSFAKQGTTVKLTKTLAPVIIFEPTGMSTPFTLTLRDDETQRSLTSLGDGRVSLGEAS